MFNIDYEKYPKGPGLTLDQARETANAIKEQYAEQIKAAKGIENRLGANRTSPDYLGS
jgi:hypothetical protein